MERHAFLSVVMRECLGSFEQEEAGRDHGDSRGTEPVEEDIVFDGRSCFMDAESGKYIYFSPTFCNEDCTELHLTLSVLKEKACPSADDAAAQSHDARIRRRILCTFDRVKMELPLPVTPQPRFE
eukprot:262198-Rhodomonas_salina.1